MDTRVLITDSLTEEECWHIVRQAEKARDTVGSPLLRFASQPKMVRRFLNWAAVGQLRVFRSTNREIIGILIFDVGMEWWSAATILSEIFVFCVSPAYKGFGRLALQELERLAKEHKAQIITSGCFFMEHPQIVTNMYKKTGFTVINPVYAKIRSDINA